MVTVTQVENTFFCNSDVYGRKWLKVDMHVCHNTIEVMLKFSNNHWSHLREIKNFGVTFESWVETC